MRATGLYALFVVALMTLLAWRDTSTSLSDFLLRTSWGATREGIDLVSFSAHQLIFLGFSLMVASSVAKDSTSRLPLLAVRHGSLSPWLMSTLARAFAAATVLVGGCLAFAAAVVVARSGTLITPQLAEVAHQYAINGVLQAQVVTTSVVLVLLITGSDRAVVGVLATLTIVGLPVISRGVLPSSLDLLGHLADPSFSVLGATVVLVVTLTFLTGLSYLITRIPSAQRHITGRIHVSY